MDSKLDQARNVLRSTLGQYQKTRKTRIAYLGDGKGQQEKNLYHPNDPNLWAVRETLATPHYFYVRSIGVVRPAFNLPVVIGYTDANPVEESILSVFIQAFGHNAGASIISGIGAHHRQHEWGGGDEVFIDPKQFKEGLVAPTNPPSTSVIVNPFYYGDYGLTKFPKETTIGMDQYLPSASYQRYVLISLNPETDELEYKSGEEFLATATTYETILAGGSVTASAIPSVPYGNYPLAAILLSSDTSTLDWNINDTNNIYPIRYILNPSLEGILGDIASLKSLLGFGTIPTLGANQDIQEELVANAAQILGSPIANSGEESAKDHLVLQENGTWKPVAPETRSFTFNFNTLELSTWPNLALPVFTSPRGYNIGLEELIATATCKTGSAIPTVTFALEKRTAGLYYTGGTSLTGGELLATSGGSVYQVFSTSAVNSLETIFFVTGATPTTGSPFNISLSIFYNYI